MKYYRIQRHVQANLVRAYGNFNEEMMESCSKQSEFRAIVFALAFFHAAILERKKFGVRNMPGSTSGDTFLLTFFSIRLADNKQSNL